MIVLLALACGGSYEDAEREELRQMRDMLGADTPAASAPMEPEALEEEADFAAVPGRTAGRRGKGGSKKASAKRRKNKDEAPADDDAAEGQAAGGDEGGQQVRQWFPESFLWRPMVQTDDNGKATLPVKVPDQLTTWRLLALAHSAEGKQAGTVHTFDSRMDVYVDPVVPGWLYSSDQLDLPVQVVNATDKPVEARLSVEASGALAGVGAGTVLLDAHGSTVRAVPLTAEGAGPSRVKVVMRGMDEVHRRIPVTPVGRPVERTRGGVLSDSASVTFKAVKRADPKTQELVVQVFPGPLAVLAEEVERIQRTGSTPRDGMYGFALSSRLVELSASAGIDVDPKAVRKLRLVSWQRVVRQARSPKHGTASDLLLALRGVSGFEQAEALKTRLVHAVTFGQRADGSWARQSSASLQQVVVQTAYAARSLPESEPGARLRASGAIERYLREVKDPYTAAVVLASGAAEGSVADTLREVVRSGLGTASDGHTTVSVPADVRNAWGYRPTHAEVLAWTALALRDDDAVSGDLIAELMARYDATRGFGAGPADVIALEAVSTLLPGTPTPATVTLFLGDKQVAQAQVDPSQPKVPAMLEARPRGHDGPVRLEVSPAVPGLAWLATQRSWVPWTGKEQMEGVELAVTASKLQVGRDGKLMVTASAPSKVKLVIEQGLPAGATVDEQKLKRLKMLEKVEVETDRVRLHTRAFGAGEIMEIPIGVRPAFAGSFSTLPLTVGEAGKKRTVSMPPLVWKVAGDAASGA